MDPAGLLTVLGATSLVLITAGRVLTTWHLPITEVRGRRAAWCQGCDRVRWAHQMSWTSAGTLRCITCAPSFEDAMTTRRTP